MSQKITLRRGTEANRLSFTPSQGEPIYITDTKVLYVGDGVTAGGISVTQGFSGEALIYDAIYDLSGYATGNFEPRTNRVRVRDFGAIGNGIADDTTGIQNAINYALTLGNAIVEFEPRTYNLNSANPGIPGGTQNKHCLHIQSSGARNRLYLRGNGAKLYSNIAASHGFALAYDLIKIRSKFDVINFDSITFERGNLHITGDGGEYLYAAFAAVPLDESYCRELSFNNCDFVNCNRAFNVNNDWSYTTPTGSMGKLQNLKFTNCSFLYPSGSNMLSSLGGGQTTFVSTWVDNTQYEKCFFDGLQGGRLPANSLVSYPKDGFIFGIGLNTTMRDCLMTNFWVEGVYLYPNNSVANVSNFTQPGVGNQVDFTVESYYASYEYLYKTLLTGDKFRIGNNTFNRTYVGIYKVDLFTGSVLRATRLDDSLSNVYSNNGAGNGAIGSSSGSSVTAIGGLGIWPTRFDDIHTAHIDNCVFKTNLMYKGSSGLWRATPAIQCEGVRATITNNKFEGHGSAGVVIGSNYPLAGNSNKPSVVSNNVFYSQDSSGDISRPAGTAIYVGLVDGVVVNNNIITSYDSASCYNGIVVRANNAIIRNNIFTVRNPDLYWINQSDANTAIRFLNTSESFGWKNCLVEDNINYGFDISAGPQNGQSNNTKIKNFLGDNVGKNEDINAILVQEYEKNFQPTGNGWHRITMGKYDRMNGEITIGGLKVNIGTYQYGSTHSISYTNNDGDYYGVPPISKIRTLSNSPGVLFDVYVKDSSYYASYPATIRSTSLNGRMRLLDPIAPSRMLNITKGANGPIIYSPSHGLRNGDYIYISNTKTTPSLDGNGIVQRIDDNNFLLSGSGPTNINLLSSGAGVIFASRTGNVATLYTSNPVNLLGGDVISVYGNGNQSFNITGVKVDYSYFPVSTGFSYANTGPNIGITAYTGTIIIGEFLRNSGQGASGNSTVNELSITSQNNFKSNKGVGDSISGGPPSSAPEFIGQKHFDSTSQYWYLAKGVSSVSDWTSPDLTLQNSINSINSDLAEYYVNTLDNKTIFGEITFDTFPYISSSSYPIRGTYGWYNLTWGTGTNWAASQAFICDKAILVMTGNTTLQISSLFNGWEGMLQTIQSGNNPSGYSLTLPPNTKVMNCGSGRINLTSGSGAIDILSFSYNGTTLFASIGNQFN